MRVLYPGRVSSNLEMLVFVEGRKQGARERPLKGKNQQQTQCTYSAMLELNQGHNGERQVLSPLHHPCSLFG